MITDPNDPGRVFRRWVQFADDGSIAAVHECVASADAPFDHAIDVTDVDPSVITAVKIDPALVAAMKAQSAAVIAAQDAVTTAQQNLTNAQAQARAALTVVAAEAVAARVQPVQVEGTVNADVVPAPTGVTS